MSPRPLASALALAGALVASAATAQTPLPPSIAAERAGEPATATTPPTKAPTKARPTKATPPTKAKAAGGAEPAGAAAKPGASRPAPAQRGYSETLPLPRKIDRDEIADPYGGSSGGGGRMRPMLTPSGRPGMGGSF